MFKSRAVQCKHRILRINSGSSHSRVFHREGTSSGNRQMLLIPPRIKRIVREAVDITAADCSCGLMLHAVTPFLLADDRPLEILTTSNFPSGQQTLHDSSFLRSSRRGQSLSWRMSWRKSSVFDGASRRAIFDPSLGRMIRGARIVLRRRTRTARLLTIVEIAWSAC